MKQQANTHHRDVTFQVGDFVFLLIQPYHQRSSAHCRCENCHLDFLDHIKLYDVLDLVVYELELASSKVHTIFHKSLLHLAHGQQVVISPAPLPLTEDWEVLLSSAKILAHGWVKEAGNSSLELLVQWADRPLEEASWKNYDLIADKFPSFCLGTKRLFRGDALIRLLLWRTNSRRKSRQACGDNLSIKNINWCYLLRFTSDQKRCSSYW